MCFDKTECTCLSIIVGILFGVAVGVLFGFGFIPAIPAFFAYLAIGVLAVLASPLYVNFKESCFCRYRTLINIGAIGTVILAAVGLIVAPVATVVVTSVIIGVATLFVATLLGFVLCLTRCACDN